MRSWLDKAVDFIYKEERTIKSPRFIKEFSKENQQISDLEELSKKLKNRAKKELILRDLSYLKKGIEGENNVYYELKNSFLPIICLHDIRLEHEGYAAQYDFIVISDRFICVLETKQLNGNIIINSDGSFLRVFHDAKGKEVKREGMYSPITQNQRQLDVLKKLLKENKSNFVTKMLFEKYFDDNYKSIVVLANPKTVLNNRYAKKEIKEKVIRSDQLIDFIKKVNSKEDAIPMSDKDLKSKAEKILSYHNPNKMSYLKKYRSFLDEYELCNKSESKVCSKIIDKDDLIKRLKEFRLNTSKSENVKPYIIFSDNQMMNLIECMPKNKEELKSVSGFGEVKVNKYGDEIIKIVNCYS